MDLVAFFHLCLTRLPIDPPAGALPRAGVVRRLLPGRNRGGGERGIGTGQGQDEAGEREKKKGGGAEA